MTSKVLRRMDNETNNKRFNIYHANTYYTDVVNGTIKNRLIFDEYYFRKRGLIWHH